MDGNLSIRPREPGKHQEHPQPGLHGGLGLRLGQVNHAPKPRDALGSPVRADKGAHFRDRNQPGM